MLKQLILKNWKSFRHATLYFDPLTVLIGTNASGKSNAIEALEFLKIISQGKDIVTAFLGNSTSPSIRGGAEWAAFKRESQFTLKVLVQGEDDNIDYLYSITIETTPRVQLHAESLERIEKYSKNGESSNSKILFKTDEPYSLYPNITVQFLDQPGKLPFSSSSSILSRLKGMSLKVDKEIAIVSEVLQNIFVLDPIPSLMRNYSPLSDSLNSNASNIAGVLVALPEEKKLEVEATISKYITHLPERDIQKVWAETVGRFNSDAMLYCRELWIPNQPPTEIDARGMSDGTLRFLAILTALLTRPKGSQLIIEEVDNGLHPSRSDLLVKMLREIGGQNQVDILITTHNPALMDALGIEIVQFVIVAHRDYQTGESQLTLLEDVENLPKLLASGLLGKLTTKGAIERSLSDSK